MMSLASLGFLSREEGVGNVMWDGGGDGDGGGGGIDGIGRCWWALTWWWVFTLPPHWHTDHTLGWHQHQDIYYRMAWSVFFYPSPHPWFDTNVWSFATRKRKEILRKEKSWTWFDVGRLGTGQKNYNLQPFCFSSVLSPPNEDFFGKQQIYSLQQFVSLSVAVS